MGGLVHSVYQKHFFVVVVCAVFIALCSASSRPMHRTLCNSNLFLKSAHTEWLPTFITVYLLTLEADITYFDIILRGKGSVHVIFGCQWR